MSDLENIALIFPYLGSIVAVGALGFSLRACKRQRLIDTLPTSKAQGVFIGLVELNGTADTETPIALARSYFNDIATFYNTRLESVPDCRVASLGVFQPETLMVANGFEREPVRVDFSAK